MCLETSLCFCILCFPSLALCVKAFKPFVSFRIEAFGVLVVTSFIVFSCHTVQCGIELSSVGINAFVSLLEGQGDTTTIHININDLDEELFAHRNNLLCQINMAHSKLRDMNQTLNTVFNTNKRTEGNELSNLTGYDLTQSVGASKCLPRIFLGSLQGQRDTLTIQINLKNFNGYRLTNFDNFGGVVDVFPGEFRNVNQTVHAAQIDEGTEVDDRRYNTFAYLALFELVEESGANLGLSLLKPCTARENNVVAVLVELDDLSFELLTNVRCKIANTTHLNEGCGQEASQTNVKDKTALDNLNNGTGDDAVVFLDLFDVAPCTLVLCALLGEDQATFLVFLSQDESLDFIANCDYFTGIYIVLDRKLARGNDAFGLVTDVEQNLVVINLNNLTGDEIAIVEVLDGLVNCLEEFFLVADVVDCDLRDVGAHVVRAPIGLIIGRRLRQVCERSLTVSYSKQRGDVESDGYLPRVSSGRCVGTCLWCIGMLIHAITSVRVFRACRQ